MENSFLIKLVNYFVVIILLFSCQQQNNSSRIENNQANDSVFSKEKIEIKSPEQGKVYKYGDSILLTFKNYSLTDNDTIQLLVNNQKYEFFKQNNGSLLIFSDSLKAGVNLIQLNINNHKPYYAETYISIISNKAPREYTYKVIKSYPHDDRSYTQGLEFYNGYMYEGSGQYGESMLRKYKIETGQLIQSYNLPDNVFGEGIVIFNNLIYQLTWKSRIAYKYDLNTFKLLGTFEYNTEGWGITKYNNMLVMSDGSNRLYFLNPENFTEISRIEVYDNIGPVVNLNELEYINGYIYANVYQTDNIVIINPKNGFVEGIIRLNNLLNKAKVKREPDVLNGIAYDSEKKRLFVTGKYWPELYHIEIIPLKSL